MLISNKKNKQNNRNLFLDDQLITEVKEHKHFGMILNYELNWRSHIEAVSAKAKKGLIL